MFLVYDKKEDRYLSPEEFAICGNGKFLLLLDSEPWTDCKTITGCTVDITDYIITEKKENSNVRNRG